MKNRISYLTFKYFLTIAICLLSVNAFAASEKKQLIVEQNLSKKMQADLGDASIKVKINNFQEYSISKNEIEIKGDAVGLSAKQNNELPIEFEAKLNSLNERVLDVKYDIIKYESVNSPESSFAPSSDEEFLMKELMTQIRKDYKTENIVIAIDSFENVGAAQGENKFLGVGEVRIGDLVWNKIKFDVALDNQTQKARKIAYKVEK